MVADYFAMLADDIVGAPYNKASHNRELQQIIARSRGSIEYKHQNVSAVLKGLGETWILGYKPAFNIQSKLIDAVLRAFESPNVQQTLNHSTQLRPSGLSEAPALRIDPAPTIRNTLPPQESEQMSAIAEVGKVAKRDELNRALGRFGEKLILEYERQTLIQNGRSDLAGKVTWVSEEIGDGAGYDISSYSSIGEERLIEVKTTNGWDRTPFHISRNEIASSKQFERSWCLVRVWNARKTPKAFELRPPLEQHVSLLPTSYRADFL